MNRRGFIRSTLATAVSVALPARRMGKTAMLDAFNDAERVAVRVQAQALATSPLYDDFVRQAIRQVAESLAVPAKMLERDYSSVAYSSARLVFESNPAQWEPGVFTGFLQGKRRAISAPAADAPNTLPQLSPLE